MSYTPKNIPDEVLKALDDDFAAMVTLPASKDGRLVGLRLSSFDLKSRHDPRVIQYMSGEVVVASQIVERTVTLEFVVYNRG